MSVKHDSGHDTVLLAEACDALLGSQRDASGNTVLVDGALVDGAFVDGTFGRGGHSRRILSQLGDKARLFAFDKDPQAVEVGRQLESVDPRFRMVYSSFTEIPSLVQSENLHGKMSGILLDLGVSSPQLDDPVRGFSFSSDGPLDMRMNPQAGESAAEWLVSVSEAELADVLYKYGDERYSRRIAAAIVRQRAEAPIDTTLKLAAIIKEAHPRWEKDRHPATKSFQAIRIHINGELEELEQLLNSSIDLLREGGRLVIISFHSLEDRIAKRFMRDQSKPKGADLPRHIPVSNQNLEPPKLKLVGKAQRCSKDEVAVNRRARSAVMRVAERLGGVLV